MQVFIYLAALVAANLAAAALGPNWTPAIGFALIGLDLTLRDALHDRWAGSQVWARMVALIVAAGVLSYLLNPAARPIAIASVLAFMAASLADTAAYVALRRRSLAWRVNGSNVAGALVDSLMFPALAFGAFLPGVSAAQLAAKVAGGALWLVALQKMRGIEKFAAK